MRIGRVSRFYVLRSSNLKKKDIGAKIFTNVQCLCTYVRGLVKCQQMSTDLNKLSSSYNFIKMNGNNNICLVTSNNVAIRDNCIPLDGWTIYFIKRDLLHSEKTA